jgi:hypothetical protein
MCNSRALPAWRLRLHRETGHCVGMGMDHDAARHSSLGELVVELTALVRRESNALPWSHVSFVEVRLGEGPIPDRPRYDMAAFEPRWREVLRTVNRDWVNLSACGVQGEHLVVAVEWFARDANQVFIPRTDVAVNLSGSAEPYTWPW